MARNDNEILGYLIARLSNLTKSLKNTALPYLSLDKIGGLDEIIYHRQIAVKSGRK